MNNPSARSGPAGRRRNRRPRRTGGGHDVCRSTRVEGRCLPKHFGRGVPIRFGWRRSDPCVVSLEFEREPRPPVVWVVDRGLLAQGLEEPAGIGDVRITPQADDTFILSLSSHEGHIELEVDRELVAAFVDRTAAVIPIGAEAPQINAELDALLHSWLFASGEGPA